MTSATLAYLDTAPLPVLVGLLTSEDATERSNAACAIGDRLRCREVDALAPAELESLALLLHDDISWVRFEAAIALCEARDHRGTDLLVECMSSRKLRLDAIRALGASGDRRAVPALLALMSRWLTPWADRLQAAAALCALGDPTGAAYLAERVRSRRSAESAAAVHFLGESRHPQARSILEAILGAPSHPLRDGAARALGLLGDPRAKEALLAAKASATFEFLADIEEALVAIEKASRGDES